VPCVEKLEAGGKMVVVERFPVWQLVTIFIATVGSYIGLLYYKQLLEAETLDPNNTEQAERLKNVKLIAKAMPFVYVVCILVWFMLR
jgi:hypothetical protein